MYFILVFYTSFCLFGFHIVSKLVSTLFTGFSQKSFKLNCVELFFLCTKSTHNHSKTDTKCTLKGKNLPSHLVGPNTSFPSSHKRRVCQQGHWVEGPR